jgi:hypothetical protein
LASTMRRFSLGHVKHAGCASRNQLLVLPDQFRRRKRALETSLKRHARRCHDPRLGFGRNGANGFSWILTWHPFDAPQRLPECAPISPMRRTDLGQSWPSPIAMRPWPISTADSGMKTLAIE